MKIKEFQLFYMRDTPFERLGLEIPSIELELNGIYGALGSTGSGKSTFCKLLAGLAEGSKEALCTPWDYEDHPLEVGYVFQQPEHQIFEETVREELSFALRNFGVEHGSWSERIDEAMGLVGLPLDFLTRDPLSLSGGERRRVAMASILAYRPRLLILDEPMAGIDGIGKNHITETILSVAAQGTTIIWVSHDLNDLLRYAARSLYFKSGRLEEFGATFEVLNSSKLEKSLLFDLMKYLTEHEGWKDPIPSPKNLKMIEEFYQDSAGF